VKRILHPTDFSENASKALKFAYALAQKLNGELFLLHVSDVPTFMNSSSFTSFSEIMEVKKESIIKQLGNYCTDILGDNCATSSIKYKATLDSSVTKGILEACSEINADFIVMGTKGESTIKELVLGSTTKKLAVHADCPVFAIPGNSIPGKINSITYASDFDKNDSGIIAKLVPLAELYNSNITILHIFDSPLNNDSKIDAFKQQDAELFKNTRIIFDSRVSENILESISNFVQVNKTDLLAIYERENGSLFEKLFHKDIAKQFSTHTTVPLLIYNRLNSK